MDKNGKPIKKGDIVRIEGAYTKNDNGLFEVMHAPGDPDWCGKDYSLHKVNNDGTPSKGKYSTSSWPLHIYSNNREYCITAREHNKNHATIEVINPVFTTPKPKQKGIKFLYNGIKVDGELYPAHYSVGNLVNGSAKTITVYCKGYGHFPRIPGLTIDNNSDIMADYFEKDRITIKPGSPFYFEALTACNAAEKHFEKRMAKKYGTA